MLNLNPDIFAAMYLIATILFIFGLKGLSSPKTAVRGNVYAMVGMVIAVITTLFHPDVKNYTWIFAGISLGAVIGVIVALKIQMTAMPQLVACLHSFVGLAAVLVAFGTFILHDAARQVAGQLETVLLIEIIIGSIIGAVTFTGSLIAFGKLQAILSSNSLIFKGQHLFNLFLALVMLVFSIQFVYSPGVLPFITATVIALALGFLLILPIGGADMPVVVSMLNSYSGWAAAATGFTLKNNLLITTGALVGSSGAILSYIMCKSMNRSFFSVILGGFGENSGGDSGEGSALSQAVKKGIKSVAPEDAAFVLENASKVIVVPGYGMAVAQAQHSLKELYLFLQQKGVDFRFAIHPVAGRMPGHMNVLLAEAEIPYDSVLEMDEINPEFASTDVALIIGANDVVNPAAKSDKTSPLYGMPILDAYKAKQVYMVKRSMKPGYAGVDNALFYYDNCALIFGDAKNVCLSLLAALNGT
ncbi:MAG: NAD(P)(+) transhydrogenase (Re/Si-specific) subunit beta [Deltaproteobacteria bacterium]|nr:NAD(P)(+) transhydrogenase (Re/Si-specific) subunit beta [Deltaproteobacteria bacterium]